MASNKITSQSEDTIQCLFFPVSLGSDISAWKELCLQINSTIEQLSCDYIWQRDEFKVFIPVEHNDAESPFHLCSATNFGDNIEDEWFIVHIVLEISKIYKDVIIQITDNDGDFLLIEAADHLQAWANPENTENRVFIYNNHIHIIPPGVASIEEKLDISTALSIIAKSPELTQASYEIEQAILCRIGKYPEKLTEMMHTTLVNLPVKLAALLILKPSLISPIVNAYCNHDVIDLKGCKTVEFDDCVTIKVKFTKFLYASLMHSKLIKLAKHQVSENDKKSILGTKLMCGFQMIMNKASSDPFSSKDYQKFVSNLKENGYFKNNIEGSKEYCQLLENAKEYFTITECPINSYLCHEITQLMSSNDFISIKKSVRDKHVPEPEYTGDSEEWLNINPDHLNELLLSRYGKTSKLKNNDVISSQAVATELSSFLKQTSDFEGIECTDDKSEDDVIDFESDQFMSCIEKMLNIISLGEHNANSADSDEDSDDMMNYEVESDDCDEELREKLQGQENLHDSKTIMANMIQSMKEEKASTGPTSNLLKSVGVHKADIIDSDDDVD
ncbi:ecdysoneless cell cycle regulator [Anticarsia gemmatalis]|uniref:ecdysoneless cell cycle regulator n=1 Tax=Anticarsia gemmatalis TaxID=129554 RepID=UPI003F77255B